MLGEGVSLAAGAKPILLCWRRSGRRINRAARPYGSPRIHAVLRRQGIICGKNRVARLMRVSGIQGRVRRRSCPVTTQRAEGALAAPNVLAQDFTANRPNQKWVTDVTYVHTQQGWAFLSTIKDLYDGFIVAHTFGQNNSVQLVTDMLRQAKHKEKVTDGLILHSDQGHQYTSQAYYDVLVTEYNIIPSMSRRGNCWDNAPMENFFGHLKEEYLRHVKNPSFEEACQLVDDYIYFFNYERIQLKTKQTPFQRRCLSR